MASAPVTIEDPDDICYEMLGEVAGYNRYEACGRMARLWSHCTSEQTYTLTAAKVRGFLGPKGVEAMVYAELGEVRENGDVLICGTAGRIEWYAATHDKKRQRLAGKARAAGATRDERGRLVSSKNQPAGHAGHDAGPAHPASDQPGSSQTSSDNPASVQRPSSQGPASHQPASSEVQPLISGSDLPDTYTHARDPEPDPRDRKVVKAAIVRAVAPEHARRFNALRADLRSQVPAMQPLGDPAERALSDLLEQIPSLDDGVRDACLHAIAVREAEARVSGSLQYFGAGMWRMEQFARAKAMTVAEATNRTSARPSQVPARPPEFTPTRRKLT